MTYLKLWCFQGNLIYCCDYTRERDHLYNISPNISVNFCPQCTSVVLRDITSHSKLATDSL